MASLTIKQEAFCQAYIETGNASEAYRTAYAADKMKAEAIHVKASELLSNGKVSVRLKELQGEIKQRHNVTVDSLLAELERPDKKHLVQKRHNHLQL
jgi:phage terminase small subunit